MLETSGFCDHHTGSNIAEKNSEIAARYSINQKVTLIVYDNASNTMFTLDVLSDKHGWGSVR